MMKRDIWEYFKNNPDDWYSYVDIAKQFKISDMKHARDQLSQAYCKHGFLLRKPTGDFTKCFVYKFDSDRFNRAP